MEMSSPQRAAAESERQFRKVRLARTSHHLPIDQILPIICIIKSFSD